MLQIVKDGDEELTQLIKCYQFRRMQDPLYDELSKREFFTSKADCYQEMYDFCRDNGIDHDNIDRLELIKQLQRLYLPKAMRVINDDVFLSLLIDSFAIVVDHSRNAVVPEIKTTIED